MWVCPSFKRAVHSAKRICSSPASDVLYLNNSPSLCLWVLHGSQVSAICQIQSGTSCSRTLFCNFCEHFEAHLHTTLADDPQDFSPLQVLPPRVQRKILWVDDTRNEIQPSWKVLVTMSHDENLWWMCKLMMCLFFASTKSHGAQRGRTTRRNFVWPSALQCLTDTRSMICGAMHTLHSSHRPTVASQEFAFAPNGRVLKDPEDSGKVSAHFHHQDTYPHSTPIWAFARQSPWAVARHFPPGDPPPTTHPKRFLSQGPWQGWSTRRRGFRK